MKIVKPSVTLLAVSPDPMGLIERCGRICYKSEGKITPDSATLFVSILLDRHHDSVTEHAGATLLFVCDRGVSHEIVRHRIASYSQESTRYCNYVLDKHGGEIAVIQPPALDEKELDLWTSAMQAVESTYLALLAYGCPPQIARSVLPTCLKTEIAVTMNMREWRHFLTLRLAKAAHPQMREVAAMARDILIGLAKPLFEEFLEEPHER